MIAFRDSFELIEFINKNIQLLFVKKLATCMPSHCCLPFPFLSSPLSVSDFPVPNHEPSALADPFPAYTSCPSYLSIFSGSE